MLSLIMFFCSEVSEISRILSKTAAVNFVKMSQKSAILGFWTQYLKLGIKSVGFSSKEVIPYGLFPIPQITTVFLVKMVVFTKIN